KVGAVLIKLEETGVGAAMVDEDVSLGIGGHRNRFAQIQPRRQLQEIRQRLVLDLGDILGSGFGLREGRAGAENHREGETGRQHLLHIGASEDSRRTVSVGVSGGLYTNNLI